MKIRTLVLCAALLAAGAAAAAESVAVIVQKTSLRAERQFFAATVAEARHGDLLEVLARDGDWIRVRHGEAEGWVHRSATSAKAEKRAEKKSGFSLGGLGKLLGGSQEGADELGTASSEEVALAGKGFNADVEKGYREGEASTNFSAVDRMQRRTVDDATLARFIEEGGLTDRRLPGAETPKATPKAPEKPAKEKEDAWGNGGGFDSW